MRSAFTAVLLLAILTPHTPCASQIVQVGTLKDLDSVAIAIHNHSSLSRPSLRREMLDALDEAGISVLRKGLPYLHLRVLRRSVTLWVDPVPVTDGLHVHVWEARYRGPTRTQIEAEDGVKELLAEFVRQHRIQNPWH